MSARRARIHLALLIAILALALAELAWGRVLMSPARLVALLSGAGGPESLILVDIRLPRMLVAAGIGLALGVAGAIFQSVSRNPLGSPDILGITAGAATGALIQIVTRGPAPFAVSIAALAGALVTAGCVLVIGSWGRGNRRRRRLILVGFGIGAVMAALNAAMLVLARLDEAAMANLWLAGSLNARDWMHVGPLWLGLAILLPLALLGARVLAILEMGDDVAAQLGVRSGLAQGRMLMIAVLLTGLAVGAAGPVAFVALAAPQLARALLRGGPVPVLGGGLMGAVLVLGADLATRALPLSQSVPIGQMTGILGGLYLAWVLSRPVARNPD